MVMHCTTVPGACAVHPFAILVNRIPRYLLVVTARKRDILLEGKVSLFYAGCVGGQAKLIALGILSLERSCDTEWLSDSDGVLATE